VFERLREDDPDTVYAQLLRLLQKAEWNRSTRFEVVLVASAHMTLKYQLSRNIFQEIDGKQ